MENILHKNETSSSIDQASLEVATKKFASIFGNSIHAIFNRFVSEYVEKNPTDKIAVKEASKFEPTVEINGNIITFDSKGVTLILENKNNNWNVKSLSCEVIFAPHEVSEKIKQEINRTKDSFAHQFNNEVRLAV